MAKLSARGRTELARATKERQIPESEQRETTWERTTITLMSDGKLLKKNDALFKATSFCGATKHTWGWKAYGKVKADVTVEVFKAAYEKIGYTVTVGG